MLRIISFWINVSCPINTARWLICLLKKPLPEALLKRRRFSALANSHSDYFWSWGKKKKTITFFHFTRQLNYNWELKKWNIQFSFFCVSAELSFWKSTQNPAARLLICKSLVLQLIRPPLCITAEIRTYFVRWPLG